MTIHQGRLSIQRVQFTKWADLISIILLMMLVTVGILGAVEFWLNGIVSIITITIIFILNKMTNWKWYIFLMIIIICIVTTSIILSIPWLFTCLIGGFISCIFFVPAIYKSYRTGADFEIFYIDDKDVGCIFLENPHQYKSLALNPTAFFQKIPIQEITSISLKRNKIILARSKGTIQPLYLSPSEHAAVYAYMTEKFPSLLHQSQSLDEAQSQDQSLYWTKIILLLPFLIFPALIYFLADNGSNAQLTFYLLLSMFITFVLLWLCTRKF